MHSASHFMYCQGHILGSYSVSIRLCTVRSPMYCQVAHVLCVRFSMYCQVSSVLCVRSSLFCQVSYALCVSSFIFISVHYLCHGEHGVATRFRGDLRPGSPADGQLKT